MADPGRARRRTTAIAVVFAVFAAWSLATYLLEGSQRTLLRPEATTLRALYMLVANFVLGIGVGVAAVRWAGLPPKLSGFESIRPTLPSVLVGSVVGFAGYLVIGGASTDPVALTNLYAQVLGVSIAEVVICWSLAGAFAAELFRGQHRVAPIVAGIACSSILFGLYHFAHSPPFNTIELVGKLTVVGVATSLFFFTSRDVYGTIAFHNWLGVIGVSQSLDSAGKLEAYGQPMVPLYMTALAAVALLVLMHWKVVARHEPPRIRAGPGGRRKQTTLYGTLADLFVGGAQIALFALGAPLLRRWYNRWGATNRETVEHLAGDELVPEPKLGYTRAVSIDAPPEEVWRWLIQFGQGRGGFYSYDALENLVGCKIQSADRILPEYQHLERHDLIRSGPGSRASWEVIDVDPPHHLVLMGADPSTKRAPPVLTRIPESGYAASTWQWVLRRLPQGGTRLIVRQRLTYSPSQRVLWRVVEPINFVMERAMLRGIARRAEQRSRIQQDHCGSTVSASSR